MNENRVAVAKELNVEVKVLILPVKVRAEQLSLTFGLRTNNVCNCLMNHHQ